MAATAPSAARKGGITVAVYFIKGDGGEFEMVIEDTDTITFGPAIPYPARQQLGHQLTYALRVYDSKKRLRAVFPGVFEIREKGVRLTPLVPEVGEIPMPREDDPKTRKRAMHARAYGRSVMDPFQAAVKMEGERISTALDADEEGNDR